MGGDHSPAHEVEGVVMAARKWQIPIVLVGQSELIAQDAEKRIRPSELRLIYSKRVASMQSSVLATPVQPWLQECLF
jgi:glycerol-3-phosphate acyltransferase PlsX